MTVEKKKCTLGTINKIIVKGIIVIINHQQVGKLDAERREQYAKVCCAAVFIENNRRKFIVFDYSFMFCKNITNSGILVQEAIIPSIVTVVIKVSTRSTQTSI